MAGYGDDTAFAAWLTDNGYSLPVGAPTPAVLRQRGSVYVDGLPAIQGKRFPGSPTDGYAQERAWPRTGATIYGADIPVDAIPEPIVQASYAAGWYEANNVGGLSAATSSASSVKREKVDVIETEYFEGSGNSLRDAAVMLQSVEGLLAPFFEVPGGSIFVV